MLWYHVVPITVNFTFPRIRRNHFIFLMSIIISWTLCQEWKEEIRNFLTFMSFYNWERSEEVYVAKTSPYLISNDKLRQTYYHEDAFNYHGFVNNEINLNFLFIHVINLGFIKHVFCTFRMSLFRIVMSIGKSQNFCCYTYYLMVFQKWDHTKLEAESYFLILLLRNLSCGCVFPWSYFSNKSSRWLSWSNKSPSSACTKIKIIQLF